jgi:LysR family transcriptional regulator for bpeEF and oprC
MDRFESLRIFCRVVETGSFSRAARNLDVANASVTNHVARLERHLGVRLLNRTTRTLSLTDDGRDCYERAKRLIGDLLELEGTLRGARVTPQGLLRVSVPSVVNRNYLAPAIAKFQSRYPELTLKVFVTDQVVNPIEEGMDALIRIGELKDSSMVARKVHQPFWVCAASPAFLRRHGVPKTPEDLARFPCLGFTQPTTRQNVPWVFNNRGQASVHMPPARIWMNHADSLIQAAAAGGGVIQLLSLSINPAVAAGSLTPVLEDWLAPAAPVSVIYAHRRQVPAKVRVFVDFVAALFSKYPLPEVNRRRAATDHRTIRPVTR